MSSDKMTYLEMGYLEMFNSIKSCFRAKKYNEVEAILREFTQKPLLQKNVGLTNDGNATSLGTCDVGVYGVNSCLLIIIEMIKFNLQFKTHININYEIILIISDTRNNFYFIIKLYQLLRDNKISMNTLFMIRERLMNINEIMELMKLITVPIEKPVTISYESELEFSQLKLTPYSESQFRKTIQDYMAINEVTETLLAAKK
ncbi:hypothetical protein CLIB1444_13S02740 [[Candida] jaroonii]|uniref:Uncharacterized protein n=1 Tax=[Candida] jaroonii TaxID=467808 RepID=A0ACA9YFH7_9ASCO|nr:hypothetical protein CLIB1444_13S02740 [[Candida] jaroonii]